MAYLHPLSKRLLHAFASLALAGAALGSLYAQDTYVWNKNGNGNWFDAVNWTSTVGGIPNGAGVVADLSKTDVSTSITVTLNQSATLGSLIIGDTNNTHNIVISYSSGSFLTFDSGSSSSALLRVTSTATNTTVRPDIYLLSDLVVSNESDASGTTGFLDIGVSGGATTFQSGSAGLKTVTFSSASLKRVNLYSTVRDGDGQVALVSDIYNPNITSQSLNLFADNTFTGGLYINGKVTTMNGIGDKALGGDGNQLFFDGGMLTFAGTFNAENSTVARTITLNAGGGTFEPNSGHIISLTEVIQGEGALTKIGSGTLVLSGTNTYEGGTVVRAGTLSIGADSNLGAAGSSITMEGGVFQITAEVNVPASARDLIMNGNGTILLGNFVNWYGAVSGSGRLTKRGSGTLSLNNANSTHTGGIWVEQGAIRFQGGDGAFGGAGNSVTLSSGTTFRIQQNMVAGAGRTLTLLGGTVQFYITQNFEWQGAIEGAGGLNKTQAAILTLTGQSAYAGNTTISGGTLRMGGNQRIAATSSLILNGGTFDLNGFNQELATLSVLGSEATLLVSTIDLGDVLGNSLVFTDSSSEVWGSNALLDIIGSFVSGQSVRVGTDANGLTADQLAKILINGNVAGIDANGYLTAVPEAAAAVQVAALGLAVLAGVCARRRSR